MKVLCPVDFSDTSINAARWIVKYLNTQGAHHITFLHCVNIVSRSSMFLKIDDLLIDRAKQDMQELINDLSKIANENLTLDTSILVVDPKSYIPQLINKDDYRLVVMGTQGLSALKDITVGSVTEYLINKVDSPILAIPDEVEMDGIKNVVLGIDPELEISKDAVEKIVDLCLRSKSQLHLVHVKEDGEVSLEFNLPQWLGNYENLDWKFVEVPLDKSIMHSINNYCENVDADILSLIHRRRNWWRRIFQKSLSKSELFDLRIPLYVVS